MHNLLTGDVMDVLPTLPDASVDAVLTDAPYGLSDHRPADVLACLTAWTQGKEYRPPKRGFMGRTWDAWVPGPECWREVLRVLRPGGYALVFAGTRSMDLMGMALRLAGFEVRDCIRDLRGVDHYPAWVYGFGMPKHRAQLKPAWEPIIVARKPLDGTVGTVAANIAKHGVGGLNTEGCRVPSAEPVQRAAGSTGFGAGRSDGYKAGTGRKYGSTGRWPSNVLHDGSDEVLAEFEVLGETGSNWRESKGAGMGYHGAAAERGAAGHTDAGTAARFFYAAKASGRDRWLWCRVCGTAHPKRDRAAHQHDRWKEVKGKRAADFGHIVMHPTVKPTSLTQYLATLLLPPAGIGRPRRILVPFAGSGSELVGALRAGWEEVVGIERDADYAAIAEARCAHEAGALGLLALAAE